MGRESGGEPRQPTDDAAGSNAAPPSLHLFNGDNAAARGQSDVPAEAGKYGSSHAGA